MMAKAMKIQKMQAPATEYIGREDSRAFWKAVSQLKVGEEVAYPRLVGKALPNLRNAARALGYALDRYFRGYTRDGVHYIGRTE